MNWRTGLKTRKCEYIISAHFSPKMGIIVQSESVIDKAIKMVNYVNDIKIILYVLHCLREILLYKLEIPTELVVEVNLFFGEYY